MKYYHISNVIYRKVKQFHDYQSRQLVFENSVRFSVDYYKISRKVCLIQLNPSELFYSKYNYILVERIYISFNF